MTIAELLKRTRSYGFAIQHVIASNGKLVWRVFRIPAPTMATQTADYIGELLLNPNDDTILEFQPNPQALYGDIDYLQKALAR